MVAGLIKPACGVDTFLYPAKDVAVSCGRINGYVAGAVLASIFTYIIVLAQDNKDTPGTPFFSDNQKYALIAATWAVCLLGVPPLAAYVNGRAWMVSDTELKAYMRQGMSRERATEMYAKKLMAQRQAAATASAGANIADALVSRK